MPTIVSFKLAVPCENAGAGLDRALFLIPCYRAPEPFFKAYIRGITQVFLRQRDVGQ